MSVRSKLQAENGKEGRHERDDQDRDGCPAGQYPMTMLTGKTIVVTGAGRGIGAAIARLCAQEGAKVLVNDLGVSADGDGTDARPADHVVAQIRAAGGTAMANHASVADPEGAASIISDAIRYFGRIDAVINNAGFLRDSIFHKMSLADWNDVLNVHLTGCFLVSRAAAAHFREQGSGAFVHFTSTTGLIGNVGQANYGAAKAGIVGLSTSIALDMQHFGVRSNCVAPTAWTRLVDSVPLDSVNRERAEKLKSLTPEKIAPLAAYLCADDAADITGQIFGVRGDEVFLYSRPTILRTMHNAAGWTPQSCADTLMPALRSSMQPLRSATDIINWDPL